MVNVTRAGVALLLGTVLCCAQAAWAQGARTQSVFGADPNLSDGAMALRLGDYEEGIRLTLAGLRSPAGKAHSLRTRSAARSNLCAGYLMSAQLRAALENCNEALRLRKNNWRAYSNRAVAYVMMGQLKRAAEDLEQGKRINPNSKRLKDVEELLAARLAARGA